VGNNVSKTRCRKGGLAPFVKEVEDGKNLGTNGRDDLLKGRSLTSQGGGGGGGVDLRAPASRVGKA